MYTRCKICGIKTREAALAAVEAGADALGFVFYEKSPRAVTPEAVQAILSALPPFITTVGLFVNPEAAYVESVLARVRLNVLQFHGQERDDFCVQFGVPYVKALGVTAQFDLAEALKTYSGAAALLLDTFDPVLHGGTGRAFDWNHFPKGANFPLILAGGLTPDNVGEAIRQTRPYAVDVSGGVEHQRGEKSIELIKAFVRGVKYEQTTGF